MKKIFILLLFLPILSIGQIWQKMPNNYFLFPKFTKFSDSLQIEKRALLNEIQFDTTPSVSTYTRGKMYWDETDNTGAIDLGNGTTLQLGQEQHVLVVNKTGSTIYNTRTVYVSGASGNRPTAVLAKSNDINTSLVIGVATQDILDNQQGYVTVQGIVRGFNTSTYTAGANLYLSETNAGWLTDTVPSSPNYNVRVAIALNSTNNGSIYVITECPLALDTTMALNSNLVAPSQKAVKSLINQREFPLTFSTGLTRATNTITANISTGISGGQTIYGGTGANENLVIMPTVHATMGKLGFRGAVSASYDNFFTGTVGLSSTLNTGSSITIATNATLFTTANVTSGVQASISIGNSAAATSVSRVSGVLNMFGYAWNGSASKINSFYQYVVPISTTGGNPTSARYDWVAGSIDGVTTSTNIMSLTTAGFLSLGGGASALNPVSKFHLDAGTSTAFSQKFTVGATTGQTATDGFDIAMDASGNASLWNYENTYLRFGTNNAEVLRINADNSLALKEGNALYFRGTIGNEADNDWKLLTGANDFTIQRRVSGVYKTNMLLDAALNNVLLGIDVKSASLSGNGNVSIGVQSGNNITSGSYNITLGYQAGQGITTTSSNSLIGFQAGNAVNANNNTMIGYQAGISTTSGASNTFIGSSSGVNNVTGQQNVYIGSLAGNGSTGSGSIGIGTYAGAYNTLSDRFFINNQNRTNIAGDTTLSLIYGVMASNVANQRLTINSGDTRIGSSTAGYSQFESDGTLEFSGNATVYEDLLPNSVTVGGGASAPTFSVYNGGNLRAYEFLGAATLKDINMMFQLSHTYKEGSNITPHVHLYIPDDGTGGTIKYYMTYSWVNVDGTGAETETTVSGTITRGASAGIAGNAVLSFGEITGTGKTISSIFSCRIYRDPTDVSDTFGASTWLKAADIHYERDTFGSRTISTK